MKRPCPFCKSFIRNFSEHLKLVHKDEPAVKEIKKLTNSLQKRRAFRKLLALGISKYNNEIKGSSEQLQRLRKSSKEGHFHYQCENCHMLFNQTSISKHKARCVLGNPGRSKGVTKLLGNPFGKNDCIAGRYII